MNRYKKYQDQNWRVCCKTWSAMKSLGAQITWAQRTGKARITNPGEVPQYVASAFDMSTYENANPQAWTIVSFTDVSMLPVYETNGARIIKNTGEEFIIEFDVTPYYNREDHRRRYAKAIKNAETRKRNKYGWFV